MTARQHLLGLLRQNSEAQTSCSEIGNVIQSNIFDLSPSSLSRYFVSQATAAGASVEIFQTRSDLDQYLYKMGILTTTDKRHQQHGDTVFTTSEGGIVETGSVCLTTDTWEKSSDFFLCDRLIVLQLTETLYPNLESYWKGRGSIPRAAHIMTGPSRTADVEQKLQLGAHGPRSLTICMLEDKMTIY